MYFYRRRKANQNHLRQQMADLATTNAMLTDQLGRSTKKLTDLTGEVDSATQKLTNLTHQVAASESTQEQSELVAAGVKALFALMLLIVPLSMVSVEPMPDLNPTPVVVAAPSDAPPGDAARVDLFLAPSGLKGSQLVLSAQRDPDTSYRRPLKLIVGFPNTIQGYEIPQAHSPDCNIERISRSDAPVNVTQSSRELHDWAILTIDGVAPYCVVPGNYSNDGVMTHTYVIPPLEMQPSAMLRLCGKSGPRQDRSPPGEQVKCEPSKHPSELVAKRDKIEWVRGAGLHNTLLVIAGAGAGLLTTCLGDLIRVGTRSNQTSLRQSASAITGMILTLLSLWWLFCIL